MPENKHFAPNLPFSDQGIVSKYKHIFPGAGCHRMKLADLWC